MSKMNTNARIPKAPPAPALAKGPKPAAAKPGAPKPPAGRPLPKPAIPKAPPPKPGFDQKDFSGVTKNAKKPAGSTLPKAPPMPGKR